MLRGEWKDTWYIQGIQKQNKIYVSIAEVFLVTL